MPSSDPIFSPRGDTLFLAARRHLFPPMRRHSTPNLRLPPWSAPSFGETPTRTPSSKTIGNISTTAPTNICSTSQWIKENGPTSVNRIPPRSPDLRMNSKPGNQPSYLVHRLALELIEGNSIWESPSCELNSDEIRRSESSSHRVGFPLLLQVTE
jgi:hypothetical protein